ncbi:hypothetical protein ASZ90_015176 [hydrocarbon metagenome]|jgi:Flp pilus assembly protein TadB|uniref:Uncharacterized protein n=1 Tax=hydrocarbon metagenome TaxID=938273 RepID=A0A0W8F2U8_9ZZZZ
MDVMNLRLWVIFYLICFVAVLWATFLLVQGFMLVVSMSLVAIVIGFNFFLLFAEIRSHIRKKKEMQEFISASLLNSSDTTVHKRQ